MRAYAPASGQLGDWTDAGCRLPQLPCPSITASTPGDLEKARDTSPGWMQKQPSKMSVWAQSWPSCPHTDPRGMTCVPFWISIKVRCIKQKHGCRKTHYPYWSHLGVLFGKGWRAQADVHFIHSLKNEENHFFLQLLRCLLYLHSLSSWKFLWIKEILTISKYEIPTPEQYHDSTFFCWHSLPFKTAFSIFASFLSLTHTHTLPVFCEKFY